MLRDLKYAVGSLWRAQVFTAAALISLTLGIAASAAVSVSVALAYPLERSG
jgi:hypothetical protein